MWKKNVWNSLRNKNLSQNMQTDHASQYIYILKNLIEKMDQRSKWAFVQRRHPGGHIKHLQRCSASLTIEEIEIKTGPWYHFLLPPSEQPSSKR